MAIFICYAPIVTFVELELRANRQYRRGVVERSRNQTKEEKMKVFSIVILVLYTSILFCQSHGENNWCSINCDPSIHTKNKHLVYGTEIDQSIVDRLNQEPTLRFPLRFVYVDAVQTGIDLKRRNEINETINNLNVEFKSTNFQFYQEKIESITSELKLEDLAGNEENIYDRFSKAHDAEDMITIFILDHKDEFCRISSRGISCSRTGGFSYILSERTNNVVMSLSLIHI